MNLNSNQNYFDKKVDGNFYIGTRFYKWIEGQENPTCIRLIGTKKKTKKAPKKYLFLGDNNIKMTIPVDMFMESDWKVLKNDGFIIITKTVDDNSRDVDVIVYVLRDGTLFSACRQSCINLYRAASHINDIHPVLGMSSNKVDYVGNFYNMIMLNGNPEEERAFAIYNDDTLDSILSIIDTSSYDSALSRIKNRLEKPNNEFPNGASGCSDSLENLLKQNLFMYDFYKAFDILYLPNAKLVEGQNKLEYDKNIIDEIKLKSGPDKEIENVYCLKYDKSIDLNSFIRDYILVANRDGVYIIGYDAIDLNE